MSRYTQPPVKVAHKQVRAHNKRVFLRNVALERLESARRVRAYMGARGMHAGEDLAQVFVNKRIQEANRYEG